MNPKGTTKEITVSLTSQQEAYLKQFYQHHQPGSSDNLCTFRPIHVVQNKRRDYVPYHDELSDHYDPDTLRFTGDEEYEVWYDSETELIQSYYDDRGEECPIAIHAVSSVFGKTIKGVGGKEYEIADFHSYFKAYGIHFSAAAWETHHYENVAFFFIRKEAERYLHYQAHNLKSPRIYTYSAGYGNEGEYEHFYQLLMNLGETLSQ